MKIAAAGLAGLIALGIVAGAMTVHGTSEPQPCAEPPRISSSEVSIAAGGSTDLRLTVNCFDFESVFSVTSIRPYSAQYGVFSNLVAPNGKNQSMFNGPNSVLIPIGGGGGTVVMHVINTNPVTVKVKMNLKAGPCSPGNCPAIFAPPDESAPTPYP